MNKTKNKEPKRRASYTIKEFNPEEKNVWNTSDIDNDKQIEKKNYEEDDYDVENENEEVEEEEEEEEEEKEDDDNKKTQVETKKLNIPIDIRLNIVKTEMDKLEEKIRRITIMRKKYKEIQNSGLFTSDEIKEFHNSYKFHWSQIKGKIQYLNKRLDIVKILWQKKQNNMKSLYEEGVLDDGVCEKWNKNNTYYHDIIMQLDKKLEPLLK